MIFVNVEFLYLSFIVIFAWFLIKNKTIDASLFNQAVLAKITVNNYGLTHSVRLKLLLLSFFFILLTLARPQLEGKTIKIQTTSSDIIVALDMSKSMSATDIYPNRFEFVKNKFLQSLVKLRNKRIAVIGFSNQSFLLSPLTADLETLQFLLKNTSLDNLNLTGTNILSLLKSSNELFLDNKKKQVLILSDGGDNYDFTEAINYAKDNNIKIYIYDTSTTKGATIKGESGVLKDRYGNIVITKTNPYIKELALKSGGAYLKYSFFNDDLLNFIASINDKTINKNKLNFKQNQELFYLPLILALLLLFIALFSLPKKL